MSDVGGIENLDAPFQGKCQPCKEAPVILFVLAVCSFAIGTTEFVTTGLLRIIAKDLGISIPMAGWLTSGYALGVVVGAPVITALTIKRRRKNVLLGLMILFVIGSIISAFANTFELLMLGRILSALCHGAFFGVSAVIASHIVEPSKRARAIALMFTGLTLANVLGVPLGTLMGEYFGWHSPFFVITLLGILGFMGILFFIPSHLKLPETSLRQELAVFRCPDVLLSLLVTALGFSGLLASFGYIAPMLVEVTGYSQTAVAYLLSLFGVGLVIGNYLGGKLADLSLKRTVYGFLLLLAIVLIVFVWTAHAKFPAAITLFILGTVGFGTIPPLQMQTMRRAASAPTLASAANIAAFNLGTFLGVLLGGFTISLGWGFTGPNWIGACITLIGLGVAIYLNKRHPLKS